MTTHQIHTISSESATRLTPPGAHSGMDITLQNVNNSGTIYIGGEGVTDSDYGFKLVPGAAIAFELPPKDALYAIGSTDDMSLAEIVIGLED
jgi:hypothetical protein